MSFTHKINIVEPVPFPTLNDPEPMIDWLSWIKARRFWLKILKIRTWKTILEYVSTLNEAHYGNSFWLYLWHGFYTFLTYCYMHLFTNWNNWYFQNSITYFYFLFFVWLDPHGWFTNKLLLTLFAWFDEKQH